MKSRGQPIRAGNITRNSSQSKFSGSSTKAKQEFSESERQIINNYLHAASGKSKLSSIVSQIKAKTPKASETSSKIPAYGRNSVSKYTQESSFHAYEIAEDGLENKENKPNKGNLSYPAYQTQRLKPEKVLVEQKPNKPSPADEIKAIIKKIFMFYASFGDRLNSDYIKANKVHKMMHDCLILDDNQLDKTSIDLLFCRYNKNRLNMPFDVFLTMLINISQIKFPEQDSKQAFMKLFEIHLKPLYDNLCAETDIGDNEKLFKELLDETTIAILNQARITLQKIHQVYFPFEYQIKSDNLDNQQLFKHKSDTCLNNFLKEFDICPKLLTNSTAYALYVDILETEPYMLSHNPNLQTIIEFDVGNRFSLSKFLVYIARLAIIGYSAANLNLNSDRSSSKKLLLLLEALEFSQGYVNFEKQLNLTHNNTTTLLPKKAFLKKLSEENGEPIDRISLENQQSKMKRTASAICMTQKISVRSPQAASFVNLLRSGSFVSPQNVGSAYRFSAVNIGNESTCSDVLDRKRNFLFKIFQEYASTNGNANNYKLKSIKFLKMLKNAELLQEQTNNLSQNTSKIKKNESAKQSTHTSKQASWGGSQIQSNSNLTTKIEDAKRTISTIDFDLIFIKVSGNNNKDSVQRTNSELSFISTKSNFKSPKFNSEEGKLLLSHGKFLDFGQFLKMLELIAEKLYPEYALDSALLHIIENHLSKANVYAERTTETTNNSNTGIKHLVLLLKDSKIVDVLAKLKESLHIYFIFYADQSGCMNFDHFMKFCKDFAIFPDMFSRSKLMQLFYNLATIHPLFYQKSQGRNACDAGSLRQTEEADNQVIDENLFTEALALCATEIEDSVSVHPIEKILHLLERMTQSSGPTNVLKLQKNARTLNGSYFEVIDYIRKKYNQKTENSLLKTGTKTEIDFSQIFG